MLFNKVPLIHLVFFGYLVYAIVFIDLLIFVNVSKYYEIFL